VYFYAFTGNGPPPVDIGLPPIVTTSSIETGVRFTADWGARAAGGGLIDQIHDARQADGDGLAQLLQYRKRAPLRSNETSRTQGGISVQSVAGLCSTTARKESGQHRINASSSSIGCSFFAACTDASVWRTDVVVYPGEGTVEGAGPGGEAVWSDMEVPTKDATVPSIHVVQSSTNASLLVASTAGGSAWTPNSTEGMFVASLGSHSATSPRRHAGGIHGKKEQGDEANPLAEPSQSYDWTNVLDGARPGNMPWRIARGKCSETAGGCHVYAGLWGGGVLKVHIG